jgi:hypothetical protein
MPLAGTLRRWGGRGWVLVALVQPFVLLWWLVPWFSGRSIGNDYPVYAIEYQQELLFSVLNGSYPLYVPGFHHGQSAAALSLGGLHHPIAWVCAALPGYWQGHALHWNTLFRLLSLGLAHAALWRLLRALRLPWGLGWLLSTVAIYNLRMLDMFRFAATLEAWTGTWFVVAAAGWLWLDRRSRGAPFALALATWWLVCSGHPQFAYFGAMAAGIFLLALPWLGAAGLGEPAAPWPSARAFYARCAAWVGLGLGLSASLLLPFVLDFMGGNSGRVGREYDWACGYQDTIGGVLANLVMPLRADVHGSFGGSSLVLLALLLPIGRIAGLRVARGAWLLLGFAALVVLYTVGGRAPLHMWAWKLVPFFQAFRVPGRLAQLLPVILLLLALLAWRAWVVHRQGAQRGLVLVAVIALGLQLAAPWVYSTLDPQLTMNAPVMIHGLGWGYELALVGLGVGSLVAFVVVLLRPGWRWAGALLALCVLGQLGASHARGTWIQEDRPAKTWAEMTARKRTELEYFHGVHGEGESMEQAVVREHGQRGAPFHRALARLCAAPRWAVDRDAAYALLLAAPPGPGACVLEGAGQDRQGPAVGRVELTLASYNRQVFAVDSPVPAWLIVHHPHDGHWGATVDERPVEITRADGLELAVPVPEGSSRVELRYGSAAWLAGALGSSGSLALVGILAALLLPSRRQRLIASLAAVLVATGLFVAWRASLYRGAHLGTEYSWQDGEPSHPWLPPELVRPEQQCKSNEGFQVPCSY